LLRRVLAAVANLPSNALKPHGDCRKIFEDLFSLKFQLCQRRLQRLILPFFILPQLNSLPISPVYLRLLIL
jgi:hypothetical protein